MKNILTPVNYEDLLLILKSRVRKAQIKAIVAVNTEMITLYWELGVQLRLKDAQEGWGAKVVDRLAADLRKEFPEIKGFSSRNLKYMKALSGLWPDSQIVPQAVAQLPWGHIRTLLDKTKTAADFIWYAEKTIEVGWSRNILNIQIESRLHERQGKAPTNFQQTLPTPQSDLAKEALKDRYLFDFLSQGDIASERSTEQTLVAHIQKFLVELGVGFAFVGKQYHLEVSGQDFYLDLLFYHLHLRCFVVIELKAGEFKPEYAGKLNFYLSAVDSMLKKDTDNPSIGLILCRGKDKLIAEWALKDMAKPMGIDEWKIQDILPENLKGQLPAVEEFEKDFLNMTEQISINNAWELYEEGNYLEAEQLILILLEKDIDAEKKENIMHCYGYILCKLKKYDLAKAIYHNIFMQHNDHISLHQMAMVERERGNYNLALEYILDEQKLILTGKTDLNINSALGANWYEIGKLNELLGNLLEAQAAATTCFKYSANSDDIILKACAYRLLGDVESSLDLHLAQSSYQNAIKLFKEAADLIGAEECELKLAALASKPHK